MDARKYQLSEIQAAFHEGARRFAEERIAQLAAEIDESDAFPGELFREMAAQVLSNSGSAVKASWP